MMNGWLNHVLRLRWLIVFASLVVTVIAGWGIQYVEMKSDYREFFSEKDPNRVSFNRLQDTYAQSDSVMFVIAPKDGGVFRPKVLQMVEELTAAAWVLPYSLRVDSLTNFQHTYADEEGLVVTDLVENAAQLAPDELEAIRHIAINEKQLKGKLITDAANVTGVVATMHFPGESNDEFGEVAAAAKDLAKQFREKYPDVDIYLSGMVIGNSATAEVIKQDAGFLMPIMATIIILTLLILLRSILATLATLIVIVCSLVIAIGIMGWIGFAITGPAAAAPIIIITIAVADCVHILVSYFFLRRDGLEQQAAIEESLRLNMGPITLTSVTTAIGFLSMNLSSAPPFQVLGTISAIGVLFAYLLSVSLLPALMTILPLNGTMKNRANSSALENFADFVTEYPKHFFTVSVLFFVALICAIPKNEINDQFTKFFDPSLDFRQAVDFSNEHLVGVSTLEYALIGKEEGGVNDPVFLANIDRFTQWLLTQKEVKQVTSLSDTMKRLNKDLHAADNDWYKVPTSKELAAQYLFLYEMSLPIGLDLTNQIDFSKKETRIVISLMELSTNEIRDLEARINTWLASYVPDIEYYDSSVALMFSHISVDNSRSSFMSSMIALFAISVILGVALRSAIMGSLSLLINILPAILAFGVWGLLVGQVGLSVATAVGMTLGIVVDNTVHFLSKYLNAKRETGSSSKQAIRYAFSHVGTALLVSNAVLIAGFFVLAQSNFMLNKDMGYFTAITFIMALLVDFLFLPTILLALDANKRVFKLSYWKGSVSR